MTETTLSSTRLPIAIFDFDGTLVKGDSFIPFLAFVAGWTATCIALCHSLILAAFNKILWKETDERSFIKAYLMHRLLAGTRHGQIISAAEKLRVWRQWNPDMRAKLLEHHAKGHHIVIASGGLDLYLPELLKDIPYHALICTQVDAKDGVLTGDMINGNCVRTRKAELVAEYLKTYGPFGESWGYGNIPHDLPMLDLVKHRIIV